MKPSFHVLRPLMLLAMIVALAACGSSAEIIQKPDEVSLSAAQEEKLADDHVDRRELDDAAQAAVACIGSNRWEGTSTWSEETQSYSIGYTYSRSHPLTPGETLSADEQTEACLAEHFDAVGTAWASQQS